MLRLATINNQIRSRKNFTRKMEVAGLKLEIRKCFKRNDLQMVDCNEGNRRNSGGLTSIGNCHSHQLINYPGSVSHQKLKKHKVE